MLTLTCEDFLARISEFMDGDLDGAWRQAVSDHARDCPRCAVILDTTQRTIRLAGDAQLFALPAEVAERLHARLAAALAAPAPAATTAAPPAPAPVEVSAELGPASLMAPPPLPRRRGWLEGWNWPLAWALVGAVLIIFGGVSWWQQARIRTLQGWLIDAHCAARYIAAGDMPVSHPRWCLLQPACVASGYGVMTAQGRFWRFNRVGSIRALLMLRASNRKMNLRITVRGQERGPILYVRSLRWARAKGLISVRLRAPAPAPRLRQAAYMTASAP